MLLADKVQTLPNPKAVPWALIIQIIMQILPMIPNICPTPPKKGLGETWWWRRQWRIQLDDPQAYADWGKDMADASLDLASKCTAEECGQMMREAA